MYAGYIVEKGYVRDIYKNPCHPYTLGLLASLPRLDEAPGTKLLSIPGSPPELTNLAPGCPFAPRCSYTVEQCFEINPELEMCDGAHHMTACWRWEEIAGIRL
jgi:oligopeptide transport system ATP-binding protein